MMETSHIRWAIDYGLAITGSSGLVKRQKKVEIVHYRPTIHPIFGRLWVVRNKGHKTFVLAASLLSSERKRLMLRNIRLDHLTMCLSVHKVYCGKMADRIRMPFRVVSGVGRGIGVLDGGGDRQRGRGSFGGVNLGYPILTNETFATRPSQITLMTCCCCWLRSLHCYYTP